MGEEDLQQNFNFQVDGLSALERVEAVFREITEGQKDFIITSEKMRMQGNKVTATLKGIDDTGKRLTVTAKATNEQITQVTKTIENSIDPVRKAAQAQKELEAATEANRQAQLKMQQQAEAAKGVQALRGMFADQMSGMNPEQLFRVNKAFSNVRQQMLKTDMSSQQLIRLWEDMNSGAQRLFNTQEMKLLPSLQRLQKEFTATGQEGAKQVQILSVSWRTFATAILVTQVLRAVGLVRTALHQGIADASSFQVKISQIRTIAQDNQLAFSEWSKQVHALSNAFGLPIMDVAEATYQTLSNQIAKGADVQRFMNEALRLAVVGVTDATSAVKTLTAIMNSYGLTAVNAREVSASMFRTLELGRIKLNEFGDSIGRTSVMAAELSISLDELNALFATGTIRGLKFNEVQTLISNLLLKLISPTEKMNELLGEWGVQSGQAALETFGLVGVLQKLGEELDKGGAPRIAELTGRIRATRAALLFSQQGAQVFTDTLKKFDDALENFENAVGIRFESAGAQMLREVNKIKNIFINNLGQPMIETINDVTQGFGGLSNVFRVVTGTVIAGATAWAVHKTAVIATTIEYKKLLAIQIAVSRNMIFGIGAAITGITTAMILMSKTMEERITDGLVRARENQQRFFSDLEISLIKAKNVLKRELTEQFQLYRQFYAEQRSALDRFVNLQAFKLEQLAVPLNRSLKLLQDAFRDSVRDLENQVRESEATIRRFLNDIDNIVKRRPIELFDRELIGESLVSQVAKLQERINSLSDDNIDSLSEQENRLKELFRLILDVGRERERIASQIGTIEERNEKAREQLIRRLMALEKRRRQVFDIDEQRRIREEIGLMLRDHNIQTRENNDQIAELKTVLESLNTVQVSRLDIEEQIASNLQSQIDLRQLLIDKEREQAELTKKHAASSAEELEKLALTIEQFKKVDVATIQKAVDSGEKKTISEALDALLTARRDEISGKARALGLSPEEQLKLTREMMQKHELIRDQILAESEKRRIDEYTNLQQKAAEEVEKAFTREHEARLKAVETAKDVLARIESEFFVRKVSEKYITALTGGFTRDELLKMTQRGQVDKLKESRENFRRIRHYMSKMGLDNFDVITEDVLNRLILQAQRFKELKEFEKDTRFADFQKNLEGAAKETLTFNQALEKYIELVEKQRESFQREGFRVPGAETAIPPSFTPSLTPSGRAQDNSSVNTLNINIGDINNGGREITPQMIADVLKHALLMRKIKIGD